MEKNDWNTFVDKLIAEHPAEIVGVKAKGEKFVFDALDSSQELRLDYDTTILPPKKYFLPQYETMMKFDLSQPDGRVTSEAPQPRVIIGVHPYDIAAIRQMDTYFLDTHADDHYVNKRKNTTIVGLNVKNVSDKAFFGDMGTGFIDSGYDLMMTDLGASIAIEIGSAKGEELLSYADALREATPDEESLAREAADKAASHAKRDLIVGPKGWHDLLTKNFDSAVWKEQSDKCLACGTCIMVCPTCFCYDVTDEMNLLDLTSGERRRTWDGCLLRDFTKVGTGEIFREDILDRYRHRFNRKGKYLPDNLGFVACVGCGRCSTQCLPDIADPVNLMNRLYETGIKYVEEKTASPVTTTSDATTAVGDEDLYTPMPATITRIEKMTDMETFFEITLDSGQPLGHDPGQFVEVSILGIGEAPISVSSPPGGTSFEIVVRRVGDVTSRLHAMNVGDKIGIRGPFGKGFNVEALKGEHLIFIGGGLGIVPMRSLLNHVLANRQDFGEVDILYGCKEPKELLFRDEVAEWDTRDDLKHILTVDSCVDDDNWDHEIGLITSVIPASDFDRHNTIAIVVGPPIMYHFVIKDLLEMGVPEENIIVSLERRMKCGVGKCGHCQINGVYVCKEGPVFNYKDIKDLPEAFT